MNAKQPAAVKGAEYWRSVEHLADTPQMRELISKEFPGYDVEDMLGPSRRHFMKLAGASMALAGITLSGCRRWPEEKLAPYSTNPRGRLPGVPEQYATAMEVGGVAMPLLVTSYDGRPIKIEGNPSHPFSYTVKEKQGATSAFAQASILDMYDPTRSRTVLSDGKPGTWDAFADFVAKAIAPLKGSGEGIAVLSEASNGPTALELKKKFAAAFPKSTWFEYEPISCDAERDGSKLAFGKVVRSVINFDKAKCVVSLDADLLGTHPAAIRHAANWADSRRGVDGGKNAKMNRVYIAETGFSITGTVADNRLPVDPARLYAIARGIAFRLDVAGVTGDDQFSDLETKFVDAAAADLKDGGVIAGGGALTAAGHALVHAINAVIGAPGKTVTLLEDPSSDRPGHCKAIADLTEALKAGKVTTLIILGGNPVYDAPADLLFADAIRKAQTTIHLSLYANETSQVANWHIPRAHYLESWGDAVAYDGTPGIVQPLIMPLYDGKSYIELLAVLAGDAVTEGHELLLRTWTALMGVSAEDLALRTVIERGLAEGKSYPAFSGPAKQASYPAADASQGIYLRFVADSHAYDGRYANNGWLQETPDPLTKLMWDNAALISKQDADSIEATTGDVIKIDSPNGSLEIAAYVMPGQPIGVITLPLGYGRTAAGEIGDNLGFKTYTLRTSNGLDYVSSAKISKAGSTYKLVTSQDHHIIDQIGAEARAKRVGSKNESGMIIRDGLFAEFVANPSSIHPGGRTYGLQLFQEPRGDHYRDTHAWGMAIDLSTCIGCNACALACQAENNIPVVGKIQADYHREMNWLRIDRYFKGDADRENAGAGAEDPSIEVVFQPMMCQQCENAPCEQVCPVGATVHDTEGLNTMVYNRCIGTRYCSNNCPYKVRRFNYLDFHSQDPRGDWAKPYPNIPDLQITESIDPIKRMVFNPEVTVRMRGVMEKCTYCVQRIHNTTIAKRGQGTDVQDGDILTACQQACPTQAIIFGDLNDRDSRVSKLHRNNRSYGVLDEELDTRPRTKYLAKIRNPGGEAKPAEAKA